MNNLVQRFLQSGFRSLRLNLLALIYTIHAPRHRLIFSGVFVFPSSTSWHHIVICRTFIFTILDYLIIFMICVSNRVRRHLDLSLDRCENFLRRKPSKSVGLLSCQTIQILNFELSHCWKSFEAEIRRLVNFSVWASSNGHARLIAWCRDSRVLESLSVAMLPQAL